MQENSPSFSLFFTVADNDNSVVISMCSNLIWGQIMTTDTVHCFMLFSSVIHDCAPKTPAPQALDDAAAKKLWDLSASMVGLA